MNIRCLPHLNDRDAWVAFCQREVAYCFTESPEALVDFQTSYLLITLLENKTRNGKQAIKYSIGSKSSMEPAWRFIKACDFSLQQMISGLNQVNFNGNVRDNSLLQAHTDLTVRKFFSKERTVISPSQIGLLLPLAAAPAFWDVHSLCCILANQQFSGLRTEQMALPGNSEFMVEYQEIPPPDSDNILVDIIDAPDIWQVRPHPNETRRVLICRNQTPIYSLEVDYQQPPPKLTQRGTRWTVANR